MNAENSKPAHCKKYIWGMLNIEASIWLENILVYLSLICSSKLAVFAFVRFSEQTMFADKYATMKAIFYLLIGCKRFSMDTILLIWFKKKKTVKKKFQVKQANINLWATVSVGPRKKLQIEGGVSG